MLPVANFKKAVREPQNRMHCLESYIVVSESIIKHYAEYTKVIYKNWLPGKSIYGR